MRFRKKPVVIEAVQYRGERENFNEVRDFVDSRLALNHLGNGKLGIPTLEGIIEASPGDWIIRGVKGEFYPCKPDIFAATYEPIP